MKRTVVALLMVMLAVCLALTAVACEKPGGPVDMTGVTFADATVSYDGSEHTITASGQPEGATVTYSNAGPYKLPGSYQIGVTITAEGYNDYQKTVTLTINALNFDIDFEDDTVNYNGENHTIVATGQPSGATVTYTNAGPFVNAGEYNIGVSISKEGYNTFTKTVKLKINKIPFPTSIVFEDEKFIKTGGQKTILVEGDLPEGTEVVYSNNVATDVGEYNASATLKNPNYIEKTLYAKLTIISLVDTAKNTVDEIMTRPDPWSFMPEAFSEESLAYTSAPTTDFSNSVNVNNISTKYMGKQLYTLWEGVKGMEGFLEKFDMVYAVGESIVAAYQNFINDNPDNYSTWETSIAGFDIKLTLVNKQSKLLVGNSTFSMELFADSDENINTGRIQLADNAVVNYEMSDDHLKFNMALTIKGVMVMKQVEFIREDDVVTGYFYQYTGLKSVAVKTSAVIAFNEDYAVVTSAKRESDDLIIEAYEEVYSATTGKLLAAEVIETNKLVEFDTHWVNLFDVTGINSIKAIPNGDIDPSNNNHDVYINGLNTKFEPKYNTIAFVKTSRRFDIEMKDVFYVVATQNGEDIEYSVVETKIPMLFIQDKNVEDFGQDAKDENSSAFASMPTLPIINMAVSKANIEAARETLDAIKEVLTYDELVAALGQRDSFFD